MRLRRRRVQLAYVANVLREEAESVEDDARSCDMTLVGSVLAQSLRRIADTIEQDNSRRA